MSVITIKYSPNPNSIQFFVEHEWITCYYECKTEVDSFKSPLTKALWQIYGIVYILIGKNFVILNKDIGLSWDLLIPKIQEVIADFLFKYEYIFPVSDEELADCIQRSELRDEKKTYSDFEMQIDDVLTEKIQPGLELHGGGVHLVKFEDGVVFLRLMGACIGCPSSAYTVEYGVLSVLQMYFKEVEKIVVV